MCHRRKGDVGAESENESVCPKTAFSDHLNILFYLRPQSRAIDQSDCRIAGSLFPIDTSLRVVYRK